MQIFKIVIFFLVFLPYAYSNKNSNFPIKDSMRLRVDFWKKVYTQINSNEAFIHDSEDLTVIYKKVNLSKSRRQRYRQAKKEKRKISRLLRSIAKKKYKDLNDEENKLIKIIGMRSTDVLISMSKNIRYQYGLRDRYYKGLIRSYKFLDFIKKAFKKLSLPEELVYLPHVESSFNYNAYSKVGAAGIWQFMRSTGRVYGLKVNYIIDERRDPLLATTAAARLLRDNYEKLQSWPLALTAYNHGAKSMERAIKQLKTKDINTIIEKYDGRRFGFASKNFYATFMATVEISKDPQKYFKSFKLPKKFEYITLKLDRPYTISEVSMATNIKRSIIKDYNQSIRAVAYRSDVYIPKGYELKLPKTLSNNIESFKTALGKVKTEYENLEIKRTHIVTSGESLYYISKVYKVKLNQLISYNQISNPSQVYPGMRIKIPGKKELATNVALKNKKTQVAYISEDTKQKKYQKVQIKEKIQSYDNLSRYKLDIQKINKSIYQIFVEAEETLGHYAEWAKIKTKEIRDINQLRYGSHIYLGQKLLITLDDDQLNTFKQLRAQFHLSIQEDFFANYKVTGTQKYLVKRGDTIENLLRKFSLPLWLIRSSDNDKLTNKLKIGQTINIPKIESIEEESSLFPGDSEQDS